MTTRARIRIALVFVATFFVGALLGVFAARRLAPKPAEPLPFSSLPARTRIRDEHLGKLALFVLAGQSNMSGRGPLPIPTPPATPSVYVFGNDGHWHEGREPVDFAEGQIDEVSADPGAGFGPSVAFAGALRERRPGLAIGLVPCARGGSAISEWTPSLDPNTLYGSCLSRALATSAQGKIAGILWFQGEADAVDPALASPVVLHPDTWASEFSKLVTAFRADLKDPDLPVVFAELGTTPAEGSFPAWESVKAQQRAVSLPGVSRIRTDDLPLLDAVHFTTESYGVIGYRFAEAMDSRLSR